MLITFASYTDETGQMKAGLYFFSYGVLRPKFPYS